MKRPDKYVKPYPYSCRRIIRAQADYPFSVDNRGDLTWIGLPYFHMKFLTKLRGAIGWILNMLRVRPPVTPGSRWLGTRNAKGNGTAVVR